MDRKAQLADRFKLIDSNSNGKLEVSELKAVFGEHADEFLKFCDDDGDKSLTCDEFTDGILNDVSELSDAEFQVQWLDRMAACITDRDTSSGAAAGNVTKKEDIMAIIAAATEDKDAVTFPYGSDSKLTAGLCTDVTLPGGFTLIVDEPEQMPGGSNKGANPLDILCGAFGTCQEITYKLYATVMEIPLTSVSCSVKANLDLRGLVGLCDDCVGFTALEAEIKIDSTATDEQLETLKGAVDTHCPMVATLAKSVPVTTTIKKECTNADAAMDPTVQKEQVMGLIAAAQEDENCLKFGYSSSSVLCGLGLDTKLTMPLGHEITVDEPSTMPGGNDKGPNPLDLLCAALGTCQEITYKLYSTVMDIPLTSVSACVKAPLDLRGLLGLDDNVVGFAGFSCEITIDSPATDEQMAALKAKVDAHCPMNRTLANEVAVEIKLVRA
jgi:uncharacterized OsmC-like protein